MICSRLSSDRLFLASALVLLLAVSTVDAGKSDWETDINAAMQKAQAEGKDLLLDFTGSDWCHWCIQLTNEVFNTYQFVEEAKQSFILVELDFPSNKALQTDYIAVQNQQWSEKFSVDSFPTVILADAQGRPYAKTGYKQGGASLYLPHLADLKQKKIQRDEALDEAKNLEGVAKAESLDKALRAVGVHFAFSSYDDVVAEIMKLDANDDAGLHSKYTEFLARRQVGKEVQQLMACYQPGLEQDYIQRIKELESRYQPEGRLRAELRGVLAQLYIMAKQPGDALQVAEEILSQDSIHPQEKLQWRVLKAVALSAEKKVQEAFAVIDSIAADHSDNETIQASCVGQKAQIMVENNRISDAHKIVQQAITSMSPGETRSKMQEMLVQIESRMNAATFIDG